VHLKYEGTDASLIVNFDEVTKMRQQFERMHQQRYGFVAENKQLIVEEVSAELICPTDTSEEPIIKRTSDNSPQSVATVQMYAVNSWHDTPVFKREDLQPGDLISSPAIIIEPTGTNVIELGWQAEVTNRNHLILQRIFSNLVGALADSAHEF
jgi:5-oxoprolinase (ATP-hydrolysing)